MATSAENVPINVAILGNPNTGKSTVFGALSGVRQRVGNYPGVTVEKRIGAVTIGRRRFALIDLPGTYSLAPRSPDEMVVVDTLLGRRDDVPPPDVVLCIVDASNLDRNLYLLSQVLELELPTVVALNMTDVALQKGISLDVDRLRRQLGVPVVETQAHRKVGVEELKAALASAPGMKWTWPESPFPVEFSREVDALWKKIQDSGSGALPRFLVERLLLDVGGYLDRAKRSGVRGEIRSEIALARKRLAAAGFPVPGVEASARYVWVSEMLDGVVTHPYVRKVTLSDKLDHVLMHKVWGTLVFFVLMALMFQSIFQWAVPLTDFIQWGTGQVGDVIAGWMPEGAVCSLLVDGVVAGVGSVLAFLPQILILFLFIAVLEDCGYMARAAYLTDRLMSSIGLSGKSFIPLLSSFACAVPGIMAARVIENRRDRLVTILIAPLMSCSARFLVYSLLIAAFIPPTTYFGGWVGLQGITLFGMYMVGIVTAILVALILKLTILKEPTPPFVMELPGYKIPTLQTVLFRVVERGWRFVRQAGTVILAASIVVWAAAYYPRANQPEHVALRDRAAAITSDIAEVRPMEATRAAAFRGTDRQRLDSLRAELAAVNRRIAGAQMRQSYLGRLGHLIQPAVRPLGWDWRIGCGVIASFPAREVVISTLGVIYNLGDEQEAKSVPLRQKLKSATWEGTDRPVYNVPVALSIMVFFALCAQCAATLAVIRRESNSWVWPVFAFTYMTGLAYLAALATYQIGMLFAA